MVILLFLIFILSPIVALPFSVIGLYRNCNRKAAYGYILIISASLSVIAYHIEPEFGWDVYQYYMRMRQMQSLSTLEAAKNAIEGFQVEPISYLLMFLISKTGKFGLYPAISTFFTYFTCLSVTCSIGVHRSYSKKNVRLMLLILVTWLASDAIFSGIRYNMAYTFFVLALFTEYTNNKCIAFAFYVCALLTHASITLFIVLRILLPFSRNSRFFRNSLFILMSFWSVFFGPIENLLSKFTFFNTGYIASKVSTYSYVQSGGSLGVYIVRYDRLFLCLTIALFLFFYLNRDLSKTNKDPEILGAQVGFLVFGSFNRLIYIARFFQVFAALTPFFIIEFLNKISDKTIKVFVLLFIMFSSLVLFYNQLSVFEIELNVSFLQLLMPTGWLFG